MRDVAERPKVPHLQNPDRNPGLPLPKARVASNVYCAWSGGTRKRTVSHRRFTRSASPVAWAIQVHRRHAGSAPGR
jgi:hypothetical protein